MFSVAALPAPQAFAQGESGRASIGGRVADSGGAIVPNAELTLLATQTGQTRKLHSDSAGRYNFASLPVGSYSIQATAPGFEETAVKDIVLSVGQSAEINISLSVGAVQTTVTVDANSEETDLTRRGEVDNQSILDNNAVENLPTRGRNFTDFALLTPGISQELDRFGLVVNGQRSGNSNISLDGVDFDDPLQNGQRGGSEAAYFFPQVAVREFQVVRTGVTAEVGRTNAGFVNVVTKSGTNRLHGEALYANRNPWLTWPDALNDPESSNNENQYALGVGGRILRDRLFFFAGAEKTNFHVPFFVRWTGDCPTAGYYDPTGLSQGCQLGAPGAGTTPLPANITALETTGYGVNNPLASSARLDWQIDSKNTAMLQYMSTFLSGLAFGASGVQDAAASSNDTYSQQSQGLVLGLTTVFSSALTNDAHVQWVYDNRQQVPNTTGAEIDIGDLGTIGGNVDGTLLYRAIREELIDNVSWLRGKHSLRFGIDVNIEPETQQREANYNGVWTVDTFADYLAALPVSQGGGGVSPYSLNASSCGSLGNAPSPAQPPQAACAFEFQQTVPLNGAEPRYRGTQKEFAGYIQDNFHVTPRLTLNFGLRYEAELEPVPPANPAVPGTGVEPSDLTQWQPRVGLAWDVHGDGRTVFRASSGIFDARTPGYILARNFTDNGLNALQLDSNYDQTLLNKVPVYGSFSAAPATTNAVNDIYSNQASFKNPRSFQAAATVEQMLTKRIALVIAGTHQESWKLQHRLNVNLFQPTIDPATLYPVFPHINPLTGLPCTVSSPYPVYVPCRPNPNIAGLHLNFSSAHSTYDSLIVQVKGRFTKNLTGAANFTWATSRDDDSNERDYSRELALDPFCTSCYNKGYSKQDIRDQFNLHLVYKLPLRFTFSSSFITRTPLPYTAITSGSKQSDFNFDGDTANDRPILCSPIAFTVCPVSTTQINSYKGTGAEVGTVSGRDTFRQNGFLNWDMRMIKAFRLHEGQEMQVSAECLNCSRSSNLNLGANEVSKFTHSQPTMNPVTGYYYSGNNAGKMTNAYDTFRSGGPRQIQLGARYIF